MKYLILSSALFVFGCSPHVSTISSLDNASSSVPNGPGVPVVPPINPEKTFYTSQITELASTSSCAKTSWANRGRSPAGYIKGMALSYARSLCRIKKSSSPAAASILKSPSSGNAAKDILAHYQDLLAVAGLQVNVDGDLALRSTYTVGIGLGMRESSGKYCEGWDTTAGANRPSAAGEAGLFQVSYDSMGASAELRKIYDEYQATPSRCLLNTFKEGATCGANTILGTGAGADFQVFMKQCPAFTTEYAMTLIRVLRTHFGPLNRKEAQVMPACDSLFSSVEKIVNINADLACSELF
jgi:hypothetical protein